LSEEEQELPTRFQIFVLSYLYSQELFLEDREYELDKRRVRTHHLQSRVTQNAIEINVKQLATILPPSIISKDLTVAEMIRQLSILVDNGYLHLNLLGSSSEGFGSVSITTDGILLVKKIFGSLKKSIRDKKNYQRRIESLEGNSDTKKWLRSMWNTLKDKAQDETADLILSQVKIQGPQLIGFMIRYSQNGS